MSARVLCLTGTDTGVGKTTVGVALAATLRGRGVRVGVFKPVETGCVSTPAGLLAEDATRLAAAAGFTAPPELICPYRLALPASPEAAARSEGTAIDPEVLTRHLAGLRELCDVLLVEGAGGLLVPWTADLLFGDLVAGWGHPALVVARSHLGTLNHTLLTLEAARIRGIRVVGVVLNQLLPTRGPEEGTTAADLAAHGRVKIIGTLPHVRGSDPEVLARLAEGHLDLEGLWRSF